MKQLTFVLIAVLFFSGCQQNKANKPETKHPNVLFILVDDLGYHDLSITGSPFYETPNIDKLANKSVMFTQGYAAASVCSPSRA
ncbi:MAG: sulfatase-like hydrolase/transferase, partial [Flavobacteriaceae bacterium]